MALSGHCNSLPHWFENFWLGSQGCCASLGLLDWERLDVSEPRGTNWPMSAIRQISARHTTGSGESNSQKAPRCASAESARTWAYSLLEDSSGNQSTFICIFIWSKVHLLKQHQIWTTTAQITQLLICHITFLSEIFFSTWVHLIFNVLSGT